MRAPTIDAPPTPPPRPRAGPLGIALRAWRTLRKMRTAIILLFVLAAGASIGSLFPQRPVNEFRVNQWIQDHPTWVPLAERLGLFDVYGSWWFTAIYVLLLVSVVGCIVPRYRALFRQVRSRPRTTGELDRLPNYHTEIVGAEPDRVLAGAEALLRRRRFRLARSNGTIAGEKGHVRELGSIVFHTAFLLLLVGIIVGKGYGFSGQVAVVEGQRFTDTHVAYDQVQEGRFFNERHRGFSLELDDFDVSFHANAVPRDFISHVRLYEEEREIRDTRIRVNEPLVHRGVSIFQLAWGWAPRVVVTQNGRTLADAPVIVLADERRGWRGVVKVPQTTPRQLGLELYFFNDLAVTATDVPFNRSPYPRRPVVFFQSFRGDLGLDRPQSVYALDHTALSQSDVGGVPVGGSFDLGDGITVSFPELKQYSVFQIASDPGTPVILAAAILILVGLIPALYSSRRRVWVRAHSDAGGARVEVAGQALQRKAAFEEEFKAFVRSLDQDLARSALAGRTRDG
jgi:cytochrome c biogenesis protein